MNAQPYDAAFRRQTPDIVLSGATVDFLLMYLQNATVFVKSVDGLMHPLVDPAPVIGVLRDATMAEAKRLGIIQADGAGAPQPDPKPN